MEQQIQQMINEFFDKVPLKPGEILVVGCSSSEVLAERIGTHSSAEVGELIYGILQKACKDREVYLAAQCCEHLNRALVVDQACAKAYGLEEVNAVPQVKAGGSFATAAYKALEAPTVVETIQGHGGIDIGDTLIGMHLRRVAVPVRLSHNVIGSARVVCARTRPRYIGGERAHYNDSLR